LSNSEIKAIAFEYSPPLNLNLKDKNRATKVSKILGIDLEIVNVDFNDVDLSKLEDVILKMPFAAHLGVGFLKMAEVIKKNMGSTMWCGQNADTFYNFGPTEKFSFVNRFLIHEPYIKMLPPVMTHEKYKKVKVMIDRIIFMYSKVIEKRKICKLPRTVSELINYFAESEDYSAIGNDKMENMSKSPHIEVITKKERITTGDVLKALFDLKLCEFATGGDNKIVHYSAKLNNITSVLPFSTQNMLLFLRNINRSIKDVILPKRFIYEYSKRELGIPRSFYYFVSSNTRGLKYSEWEREILNRTMFGEEIRKNSSEVLEKLNIRPKTLSQFIAGFWVTKLHKTLEENSIAIQNRG